MNQIIAIRVDGNSKIGFGHLMRTQALARQLEKRGAKVIFLSRNPENVKGHQVEVISLNSGIEEEDVEVRKIIESCKAEMLIIDSYAYDQKRLDQIDESGLMSVYIDDLNRHPFKNDLVVNGNLYAPDMDYRGSSCFLLGAKYLMMREEFAGIEPRSTRHQVQDIFMSLGAADTGNITPRLLEALFAYQNFSHFCWHVVIGPVFRNAARVESLVKDRNNVLLYYSPDIKKLMEFCDISINAAGSTSYELAASGVPALLLVVEDNQVLLAEEAERQGIALNLGWYSDVNQDRLFACLDKLIGNYNLRKKISARGQVLIDGRGAERVAEALLEALRRREYDRYRGND